MIDIQLPMGLKEEYFWLKRIVESDKNESHHRPALRRLIDLYAQKWNRRKGIRQDLVSISVKALRDFLRQG